MHYKWRSVAKSWIRKIEKVKIESINTVDIYPSIMLMLVRIEVYFYTKSVPKQVVSNIDLCLNLIGLGISLTLLNLLCKYY